MKKRGFLRLTWPALVFFTLIVGLVFIPLPTVIAQEPPPDRPDPPTDRPDGPPGRPEPPSGSGGSGGASVPGGSGDDTFSDLCPTVHGLAINWGYRNIPKLPVKLSGPGWQTQRITDDNGYYASECMGLGIALLNLASPPGLNPLTTDVAIRLGYKSSFEVNLGLYGDEVDPKLSVIPIVTASDTSVLPDETLIYTIQATNTFGTPASGQKMWGVMVTDLLPEGLIPVAVTSTLGDVELWGNLVTADIGQLESGQTATIIVTTIVREDVLPASLITNRVSLIHQGHVAVQSAPMTVEVKATESHLPISSTENETSKDLSEPPTVLPETGAARPGMVGPH